MASSIRHDNRNGFCFHVDILLKPSARHLAGRVFSRKQTATRVFPRWSHAIQLARYLETRPITFGLSTHPVSLLERISDICLKIARNFIRHPTCIKIFEFVLKKLYFLFSKTRSYQTSEIRCTNALFMSALLLSLLSSNELLCAQMCCLLSSKARSSPGCCWCCFCFRSSANSLIFVCYIPHFEREGSVYQDKTGCFFLNKDLGWHSVPSESKFKEAGLANTVIRASTSSTRLL